jgi:hypothetical protein
VLAIGGWCGDGGWLEKAVIIKLMGNLTPELVEINYCIEFNYR